MRSILVSLLAAGAAVAFAGPAAANQDGPSIRQIYDAGRCMVDNDRGTAVNFLQSLPVEEGEADLSVLPERLGRRCAEGLGRVNSLHVRGAIAQALFFRDFGGYGLEPRRSVPMVNLNIPAESSPPGAGMTELYRWADCVVRNDGNRAERLLASRVGSQAETAAIDGMRAFMAACAPQGQQLSVRPSDLRSLVAQSAYNSMFLYWTRQLTPVRDQ